MKKLFPLLILSFFSAQSFAGSCPDGSEPIKSVSEDGSYYVYNCGNTNNEPTSSSVDTEEAIEKELAEFEAELEAELAEAGASKLKVIPANAQKTTDGGFKCKYGFYQNNNDQFSCSKLPAYAAAYGSGPGFFCKSGYLEQRKKYETVCVKSYEPNNKAYDITTIVIDK